MNQPNQQPAKRDEGGQANEGEGNRTAARRYNEATQDFVEQGKVERAAEDAAPRSSDEAEQMKDAEREGRSHAKEEDPALRRGGGASRSS